MRRPGRGRSQSPRALEPPPWVRLHRRAIPPTDIAELDILRVTTAPRTCLDLAHAGRTDVIPIAVRLGLVTPAELRSQLDAAPGRRGRRRAAQAVAAAADAPWSPAEQLAHMRFREAGLSGWVANPRVRTAVGSFRPDIAFEDVRLAIEIDGRAFHGADRFEADRRRHNALVEAGWTVLQVTSRQLVDEPERVVALVRRTLTRLRATRRSA